MPPKGSACGRLWSGAVTYGQHALEAVYQKVLRIGPRIFLYLAACLWGATLTQLIYFQEPAKDGAALWLPWWTGDLFSPFDMGTGIQAGRPISDDLRIVVFGSQDVATPGRDMLVSTGEKAPSWTEVLCKELNSSTHISLIPTGGGSQHPMVSPEIYAQAVEKLLGETDPSRGPGENYTLQLDKFPVPWGLPGLAEQVAAFTNTDAPMAAAPETLWVFTFGTWEVWSLATFPLEISKPFVSLMTQSIFEQADRLYERQSSLTEALASPTRPRTNKTNSGNVPATVDQRTRMFRILITELLDPSLLPAWKKSRPRLGRGHPKAVQMRNAALLTKQWNQEVHEKMDRWVMRDDSDGDPTRLLRDGFVFNLPQYVVDAITEGQMRRMGEQRGIPAGGGYRDVSRPCASQGRDERAVRACEAAGGRLFSTPFVVGAKAVTDIGRLAAEMVRNNESQRTLGHYIAPPQPGAWFEMWELDRAYR